MPTPNLSLTSLEAAQTQKHVTVNEAFARLDAATQLTVKDRNRTDPPPTPLDGDRYLVSTPATGAWLMQEGRIAVWNDAAQGWLFLIPKDGWRLWIADERVLLVRDDGQWTSLAGTQLGINATADDTNRLAVASDAVLFTHDGAGIQTKLNKDAETDTASLVLQTGYSTRAELGLTGDDDFHLKTSADGNVFTEAMTVDVSTGVAHFPEGAVIAGASLGRDSVVNLLPDSGRFGGNTKNNALRLTNFAQPSYITPYNGSTITGHARFVHNSSSYGGTSAAIDPEIEALHSLLRPAADRRYGPEWWAMHLTQGSGTGGSPAIVGGSTYYLSLVAPQSPMPRAFTAGFYFRVLSGTAYINDTNVTRMWRWQTDVTGDQTQGIVTPSDGWVHFTKHAVSNASGFNNIWISCYSTASSTILLAIPRLVFGHVELDPYLIAPLPNDSFIG